jgi:hypothetical protein
MQISNIIHHTKRFAKKLIRWGLKAFIWGIGITLLTLFATLGGASLGLWSVSQAGIAIELAAAISMAIGFSPMFTGCCLLVDASLLETLLEMRNSSKKTS